MLTADIYYRPMIEERENKFSLPELHQDYGQEALSRKHSDIVSSGLVTVGARDVRNLRSRNAQRVKPVTSLSSSVGGNDAYQGSPTRYVLFPSHIIAV